MLILLVNKSFEHFLRQDLKFTEIKLADYFRSSINFTTNTENITSNIQRMSLDDRSLFDASLGQEFKDSFISQLDFEKATNITS